MKIQEKVMLPTDELPDYPEARVKPRGRFQFDLIWLVPIVAILIGAWLAVHAILERGPTATISFRTADGLEAGKTYVSYKNVKVGMVTRIRLSEDRSRVLVTAEFSRDAASLLKADTRFWVVRPRFSGGEMSGLGTLLAGEHIELDVGKSAESGRDFTGLESAPVVTGDLPGRSFVLRAPDLGSVDVGSPIYYRRLKVGQVDSYALEQDGGGVIMKIFVQAPYDRFVTRATRFWNAGGVDMSLDAGGVKLRTESLVSILAGGVAFETPPDASARPVDWKSAPADSDFVLHEDRASAMKAPDGEMQVYLLNFKDSLRGLAARAPVEFRGIVVGEVLSTGVEYDPRRDWFNFPVFVALYPERIRVVGHGGEGGKADAALVRKGLLQAMLERGLRAQLRTGSLVTGQLYVALDFFDDASPFHPRAGETPPVIPTVRGDLEDLSQSLKEIAKSLAKVRFDRVGESLQTTLGNVDRVLQRFDKELGPELKSTLHELQESLKAVNATLARGGPAMAEVSQAAHDVSRASQSLKALTDLLERQPDALLKGKRP